VIVLVSFGAAAGAWQFEKTRARDQQDPRAQASTGALRSQLATVVVSLEGFRGLLEGAGGYVEPATFAPFAAWAEGEVGKGATISFTLPNGKDPK